MPRLNYVQKKLLKKVDLFDYGDHNLNMNKVIARFGLKGSKEYRQYNGLARTVQKLASVLSVLPATSEVRQRVEKALCERLHRLGVADVSATDAATLTKFSVSNLCKRRVTRVLIDQKMAAHLQHAIELVEHGHVQLNGEVVRDPATLVTRDAEKTLRWAAGSKYVAHIAEFQGKRDDFDLTNC